MPKVSVQVPEVYEAISRPVAIEVLRDLMSRTGVPKEASVRYTGMGDLPIPQPGSTLENPSLEARFPSSTRFAMEVTEDYWSEAPFYQPNLRPEHQVVFKDNALEVYIKPVYQPTEVTITVQGRFEDKTSAIRWRDDLRKMVGAGRVENIHEVSYHFPIPREYIVILNKIYQMREAVDGYGEALGDWLKTSFDERMTVITNQAGRHPTISVAEHQTGIVGWFEFGAEPPPPEKESDVGPYTVSFDYKFIYEKCIACVMQYPLVIHNQLMPADFRDTKRAFYPEKRPSYKSLSRSLTDHYTQVYPEAYDGYVGIPIPYYDDWLPDYRQPGLTDLMRIMLGVDVNDRYALMDLTQLGNHEIQADAIEYLLEYPQGVLQKGESIFQAILYKRRTPQKQDMMTIDENLVLRSTVELSLRENYHMVIGLAYELQALTTAARERLRRRGVFAQKILQILQPNIIQLGLLPPLASDGSLPLLPFNKAIQTITERSFYKRTTGQYRHHTVGLFVVDAQGS
jgi:hypothetical protein